MRQQKSLSQLFVFLISQPKCSDLQNYGVSPHNTPLIMGDRHKNVEDPSTWAYNFDNHEYYHRPVPDYMVEWDIGTLELVNHLVVARVWGPSWAGLEVTGYTDNQSAMHLLRHGRSRSELRLDIAREFASIQQHFHFLWNSDYISTKDNVLSDCLSRWGSASARDKFVQLTSEFPTAEIFIPDSFLKITNSW